MAPRTVYGTNRELIHVAQCEILTFTQPQEKFARAQDYVTAACYNPDKALFTRALRELLHFNALIN